MAEERAGEHAEAHRVPQTYFSRTRMAAVIRARIVVCMHACAGSRTGCMQHVRETISYLTGLDGLCEVCLALVALALEQHIALLGAKVGGDDLVEHVAAAAAARTAPIEVCTVGGRHASAALRCAPGVSRRKPLRGQRAVWACFCGTSMLGARCQKREAVQSSARSKTGAWSPQQPA